MKNKGKNHNPFNKGGNKNLSGRLGDSLKRPKPHIEPNKSGISTMDASLGKYMEYFEFNMQKIKELMDNTGDDNILRYCIVLICAAMDKYIHDILKTLLVRIFQGKSEAGKTFDEFMVPISLLKRFDESEFNERQKEQLLSDAIYDLTSSYTMQRTYAIERNLNHVLPTNVWRLVIDDVRKRIPEIENQNDLKEALDNLTDRRNKIAHELDYKPNSSKKIPIDYDFVYDRYYLIYTFIRALNANVS